MNKPVPLYFNPDAGSTEKALAPFKDDPRIKMEAAPPETLTAIIKDAVKQREKRVLISGGDGTIALAASILAGTGTELAILPAGTLNHFAQRIGLPVSAAEALEVALHGEAHSVDVGYVNDQLFINTSSVGAYPVFVRSRKYLQNRMHYLPASIIAGIRRLLNFRRIRIRIQDNTVKTPLVFVGVGERSLRFPTLGQVKENGEKGLHFITVDCSNSIEAFILVVKSFFFGVDPMQQETRVHNQLVDDIELTFRRSGKRVHVAVDGELFWFHAPLHYRFAPEEIKVAMPNDQS